MDRSAGVIYQTFFFIWNKFQIIERDKKSDKTLSSSRKLVETWSFAKDSNIRNLRSCITYPGAWSSKHRLLRKCHLWQYILQEVLWSKKKKNQKCETTNSYRRGRCRLSVSFEYCKTDWLRDEPCQISAVCRNQPKNPEQRLELRQSQTIMKYWRIIL